MGIWEKCCSVTPGNPIWEAHNAGIVFDWDQGKKESFWLEDGKEILGQMEKGDYRKNQGLRREENKTSGLARKGLCLKRSPLYPFVS